MKIPGMPKMKAMKIKAPGSKNAPHLHRPRMGGFGHTAFTPPSSQSKQAFSDPNTMAGPDQAFSDAMAGAGAGGTMASGAEGTEAAAAEGAP